MKRIGLIVLVALIQIACDATKKDEKALARNLAAIGDAEVEKQESKIEYGFILDDLEVIRDTIRSGDTFGGILDAHGVSQGDILEIANNYKEEFDVRRIREGKPYVILKSKDSLAATKAFIYEKDKIEYTVIDFDDKIKVENRQRKVTYREHYASGVITSSLSQTLQDQNLSPLMTDRMANIYAWTINFFKLQQNDKFKVVYTQKYINDTIPVGLGEIKAAVFEHAGKPLYSFNFASEASDKIGDFFDEEANNLRRAFLKAPVEFSRISSRYNLNRRIAYYGNKVRPHLGTDFAAPIGTPILATADGVISASERRGGNGNYVKIRHNSTYETQYLH
ncbi:MAG TPA: peptidoglycan DD-metalloendopeptidase family protein, partial [Flavobacteriaceae bacterium]|nr:peptidoglycan DD-metalloendopeptidase family protein [Flavobacteriaceae bacterium]